MSTVKRRFFDAAAHKYCILNILNDKTKKKEEATGIVFVLHLTKIEDASNACNARQIVAHNVIIKLIVSQICNSQKMLRHMQVHAEWSI